MVPRAKIQPPPPAPRHDARVAWGCPLNTWSLPPTAVGLLGAVALTHFGVVDPERRTASWVSELTDTKLRVEDCRTDLAAMLARPRVAFAEPRTLKSFLQVKPTDILEIGKLI